MTDRVALEVRPHQHLLGNGSLGGTVNRAHGVVVEAVERVRPQSADLHSWLAARTNGKPDGWASILPGKTTFA